MKRQAFRRLVGEALEAIPAAFRKRMENIAVVVEDWPPPEVLEEMDVEDPHDLLGLYQGVPLSERGAAYGGALPDRIAIYQRPIEALSGDPAELRAVIRETVIHEVGHHFGLSDEEIERLSSGQPLPKPSR